MPEETPSTTTATASGTQQLTLLDRIVTEGKMARDISQQPHAKDLVGEFVNQVLSEGLTIKNDTVAGIKDRIGQIDSLLSNQLNEIMHDPSFQQLEASWRGLNYLVMNSETGTQLKIRVLNITKKELLNDMEKATEFDQSVMFKQIYEEEYGTFGGNPYSLLVGDFELAGIRRICRFWKKCRA